MTKITLATVGSLIDTTTAAQTINNNFAVIQSAMDNTLSRNGAVPNTMGNNLDMNSNQILNLPVPATVNSPARLIDVTGTPTISVPPVGTSGAVVGLLNANKTDSGNNVFSGSNTFSGNNAFTNSNTFYETGTSNVNWGASAGTLSSALANDTNGTPSVVFSGKQGTTTSFTNGTIASSIIQADQLGGLVFKTLPANSTNTAASTTGTLTNTGALTVGSIASNNNLTVGGTASVTGNVITSTVQTNVVNDATSTHNLITRTGTQTNVGNGGLLTITDAGVFTVTGSLGVTGSILSTGATGVGYATGAGGTVTQITSRTTGVTINKISGAITLFTGAGNVSPQSFTVTNSTVAATDVIILNIKSGATNTYVLSVTTVAAGSFVITQYTTGGTVSDTPVINFVVIKGVTS